MKVSLNKANKIRNELQALQIPLTSSVAVRSDAELEGLIAEGKKKFQKGYSDVMSKFSFLRDLKLLIRQANPESGVEKLIAEIAYNENIIKYITSLKEQLGSGYGVTTKDAFDLEKTNQQKIIAADATKVALVKMVNVSCVDQSDLDDLDSYILKVKLVIKDLQEERNSLNHKTTIELPEDMVVFLREYGILR